MKTYLFFILSLIVSTAGAVQIGDTYAQVIAEKGPPTTKLQAGETQILNYPDGRIKLKDGKVVQSNAKLPETLAAAEPAPSAQPSSTGPTLPAGVWTTDYKAAMAQSRATNQKVFLFFTGSDWCGWCKRLDREILGTTEFLSYAKQNVILVKIDFPHDSVLPPELIAQNEQLAKMYRVNGFPSIKVLDSKGRLVGELGYQEGGPGPFIQALSRF